MSVLLLLVLHLIQLTGPDGQRIEVNPAEVATIREPRGVEIVHFHGKIKCVVYTTDGKFVGVLETCDAVREKLLRGVD